MSSFLSGVPGEVAYHGFLYPMTWMVSGTLALVFVGGLFVSVFYKMRLTSVYEVRSLEQWSDPVMERVQIWS